VPLDAQLDHVAVAAEHAVDLWPRYVGELGGRWFETGDSPGFTWTQLAYTGSTKVEVLEPRNPEDDDFLRRFLDRSGPGAHHLTFMVPDLRRAIGRMKRAGYPVVRPSLDDPAWREAFVAPKLASGIVVQLAESDGSGPTGPKPGTIPAAADDQATLVRIVHLVADLDDARLLFEQQLGGERGWSSDHAFELTWGDSAAVRFVRPAASSAAAELLGTRVGRLHHLELALGDPGRCAGSTSLGDDGTRAVAPADNAGVGLRLVRR
jgi:methylmalonyl-CoA/ethylmalonyl-CoA epimerase